MNAVVQYPELFEYLAYVYFPTSCMTGPVLHFCEVQAFLKDRLLPKSTFSTRTWTLSRTRAVRIGLFQLLLWVTVYLVYMTWFPASSYMQAHPAQIYRILYMVPATFFVASPMLIVWTLAEIASVVVGIGATEEMEVTQPFANRSLVVVWHRCRATYTALFFTAGSMKQRADFWNYRIAFWLRTCIFEPTVQETGSSTVGRFTALAVSAIWHVCRHRQASSCKHPV